MEVLGVIMAAVVTGCFGVIAAGVTRGSLHLKSIRRDMAAVARQLGHHLADHDAHPWQSDHGHFDLDRSRKR